MERHLRIALLTLTLCLNHFGTASAAVIKIEQITKNETQEAREVAARFTIRFLETQDLAPVIDELYLNDFIDRFDQYQMKRMAKDHSSAVNVLFVPGLEYNTRLLSQASLQYWKRFYIAANNFVMLGVVSAIKRKAGSMEDLEGSDMYPPAVIDLLDKNPNLANMIKKKSSDRPLSTLEEMRAATATLEQAIGIIRKQHKGKVLPNWAYRDLIDLMKQEEYFKPQMKVLEEEVLGFPKGTKFILVNTLLMYQLMLIETRDKLKILWAAPTLGD